MQAAARTRAEGGGCSRRAKKIRVLLPAAGLPARSLLHLLHSLRLSACPSEAALHQLSFKPDVALTYGGSRKLALLNLLSTLHSTGHKSLSARRAREKRAFRHHKQPCGPPHGEQACDQPNHYFTSPAARVLLKIPRYPLFVLHLLPLTTFFPLFPPTPLPSPPRREVLPTPPRPQLRIAS